MQELTQKEQRMFDFLKSKIEKDGYAPSVREIQSALGIKSTSTVFDYLNRLESKGYIIKENSKSRTLRLVEEDKGADKIIKVPLVGRVAAGMPITALENFEGYLYFPTKRSYNQGELFALGVKGESMINVGINNGDIIIVQSLSYAENGDIVVAMVDEEATVKTFYKEKGRYRLQPENDSMEPIIVDEVVVLGKVISLMRYY